MAWEFRQSASRTNTMNQEPTFKVTDRRLFNADGSPRDLPPEQRAEETPVVETVSAGSNAAEALPELETAAAPFIESSEEIEEEISEEDVASARDPASFLNFLMSIASNAASALGMMEHPVTHKRDVDLELGKHWIDVLGMLEKKTKGNLTAQEKQMIEGLLADLRMQYVSLANAPQKSRKFTSSDITGGR